MKANRSIREDEGVSNVLGGIMFFAILFVFFTVIRLDFVPQWEEDKEAARFTNLQGQLAEFKGEADRQATNRSSGEVSQALTVGARSSSKFLAPPPAPGTAVFSPRLANVHVETNEFRVFSRNGVVFGSTNEEWVGAPGTITDVGDILHLRMRLLDPGSEDAGDSVNLTVYDANGDFAGSISTYISRSPPDEFINTRTTSATGEILFNQGVFFHQTTEVDFWWLDALEDEVQFGDVLQAAEAPLTIEIEENGMEGEFAITYFEETAGGNVLVGGSGTTITNFEADYTGGRLDIETFAQYFVPHHFHVENGAVILDQEDGSVMRVKPNFDIEVIGGYTKVAMTIPSLTGKADAVSHSGTVTTYLNGGGGRNDVGTAPKWIYQVDTSHPDAWADFFEDEAEDAGLDASLGEYTVSQGATNATIAIYGRTPHPDSTDHDLTIELTRSSVNVRIET